MISCIVSFSHFWLLSSCVLYEKLLRSWRFFCERLGLAVTCWYAQSFSPTHKETWSTPTKLVRARSGAETATLMGGRGENGRIIGISVYRTFGPLRRVSICIWFCTLKHPRNTRYENFIISHEYRKKQTTESIFILEPSSMRCIQWIQLYSLTVIAIRILILIRELRICGVLAFRVVPSFLVLVLRCLSFWSCYVRDTAARYTKCFRDAG